MGCAADVGRSLHAVFCRSPRPNVGCAFGQHLVVNGKCALVRAERFGVKRDGFLGVGRLAAFTATAFAAATFTAAAFKIGSRVSSYRREAKLSCLSCVGAINSLCSYCKLYILCIAFPNDETVISIICNSTLRRRKVSPASNALCRKMEHNFFNVFRAVAYHSNAIGVAAKIICFCIHCGIRLATRNFACANGVVARCVTDIFGADTSPVALTAPCDLRLRHQCEAACEEREERK